MLLVKVSDMIVVQKIVGEQERCVSVLSVCVMRILSDVSVLLFHSYFSEHSEWRRNYQTVSLGLSQWSFSPKGASRQQALSKSLQNCKFI